MAISRKGIADAAQDLGLLALTVICCLGLVHGQTFIRAFVDGLAFALPFMLLSGLCSLPEDLRSMKKTLPMVLVITTVAAIWCFSIGRIVEAKGLIGEARIGFVVERVSRLILFVPLLTVGKVWLGLRSGQRDLSGR